MFWTLLPVSPFNPTTNRLCSIRKTDNHYSLVLEQAGDVTQGGRSGLTLNPSSCWRRAATLVLGLDTWRLRLRLRLVSSLEVRFMLWRLLY